MRKLKKKKIDLNTLDGRTKAINDYFKKALIEQDYKIFVHLGYANNQYVKEHTRLIDMCFLVLKYKQSNQKDYHIYDARLKEALKNFLEKVYNTIKADVPLMDFINLFVINGYLCDYLSIRNEFLRVCMSRGELKMYNSFFDNFWESRKKFMDYEGAFSPEIEKKFQDSIYWISNSLFKLLPYIQSVYNADICKKQIEEAMNNVKYESKITVKNPPDEKKMIDNIMRRITYIRQHLNPNQFTILEGLEEKEIKKDLSVVKGTLTRIEKALQCIIDIIEVEYFDED